MISCGSSSRGAELIDRYGYYLDVVPAVTLTISNVRSLFGPNNRWQGALVGHLAAFEMTSSLPNRRYAQGLRRLGFDDGACRFFDEHVDADVVHEQLALHDLCGAVLAERPELAGDVVFGAASAVLADSWWTDYLLDRWDVGAGTLPARYLGRY